MLQFYCTLLICAVYISFSDFIDAFLFSPTEFHGLLRVFWSAKSLRYSKILSGMHYHYCTCKYLEQTVAISTLYWLNAPTSTRVVFLAQAALE